MPDDEGGQADPRHSAAELLGDWRAAQRDTVAARAAASVAALAEAAAAAAQEAAQETEAAAAAAMEAATRAKLAADRAKQAAAHAAEAALILTSTAEGDRAQADQAIAKAEEAENDARARFHADEKKGFSKE